MPRFSLPSFLCNASACLAWLVLVSSGSTQAAITVSFESLPVPLSGFNNGDPSLGGAARDNFTVLIPGENNDGTTVQEWQVDGVSFGNSFTQTPDFSFWSGWVWSNVQDPSTPGFSNQYAARPGTGAGGSANYAIAFGDGAYFNVPSGLRLDSVDLTNTTYAALYMETGANPPFSPVAGFGGPSGNDPDFFQVILSGHSGVAGTGTLIGEVVVDLADYRFADNSLDFVLTDWLNVDLSAIAEASSVSLRFASSDVGEFGINTPTYVALDNLRLIPEPSSFVALALMAMASLHRGRFRRP